MTAQNGKRLAIAAVTTLIAVVVAGMLLPAVTQCREKPHPMNCAGNLKQIGLALIMYAGDDVEGGCFPPDLAALNTGKYLVNGRVYGCPATQHPSSSAAASDYTYVGAGLKDTNKSPTSTALAYCDKHDDWVNVLYIDGHVTGHGGHGWVAPVNQPAP